MVFPILPTFYFMLATILVTIFYTKSQEYYVYIAMSFSLFVSAVFLFDQGKIKYLAGAAVIFIAFLNLQTSRVLISNYRAATELNTLTVDAVSNEIIDTKEKYLKNSGAIGSGEIVTDTLTWPFAEENAGSIVTVLSGYHNHSISGAAFNSSALDFFLDEFPSFAVKQVPPPKRKEILDSILGRLRLVSIFYLPTSKSSDYFYLEGNYSKFNFKILGSDAKITSMMGDVLDADGLVTSEINGSSLLYVPESGYYLIIFKDKKFGFDLDKIRITSRDMQIPPVLKFDGSQNLPQYFLLKLEKNNTYTLNCEKNFIQQVVFFDSSHLSTIEAISQGAD